jgi:hypothetical protein
MTTSDHRPQRKDHAMHVGPYEISVRWNRRPRLGQAPALISCVVAAVSLLTMVAVANPASAGNVATGSVSVSAASLVSVTVSPDTFQYSFCHDSSDGGTATTSVQFPNGICDSAKGAVTVTNGAAPADIGVQGTGFAPSDGTGPSWQMCLPGPASGDFYGVAECDGGPGVDQVELYNTNLTFSGNGNPVGGAALVCDQAFQAGNAGCSANPGDSANESLRIIAPASSTDLSETFSNTVTWVAESP